MSEETHTLAEKIAGTIPTGWRKGVDGEGSALMYNTLNPTCFNSDPRMREAANAQCRTIGEEAAKVWKEPNAVVGQAMKKGALTPIPPAPPIEGKYQLSAQNDGIRMLRAIAPLNFELYGAKRIVSLPLDEYGRSEMREECMRNGELDYSRHISEDVQIWMGALMVKMYQEFGDVASAFEDMMVDQEPILRARLLEAAAQVTDRGWECLASWSKYCLEESSKPTGGEV